MSIDNTRLRCCVASLERVLGEIEALDDAEDDAEGLGAPDRFQREIEHVYVVLSGV